MTDNPDDKGETDNRKFERIAVLWSGTLICEGRDIDCLIVNVSPAGAMIRVENPELPSNKAVVLRSPRFGELSGDITWRKDKELGVEFSDSEEEVSKKLEKALR
jgi:PilZ domain